MGKNVKDEINFHGFLNAMRQLQSVTLERLSEGLCSLTMMQKIIDGTRLPGKMMRDRIVARLGASQDGYEDYLSTEEYNGWLARKKMLKSVLEGDTSQIEQYLQEYEYIEENSCVEQQFIETVRLWHQQATGVSEEEQFVTLQRAISYTIPAISDEPLVGMLFSEQEIYLLGEYIRLMPDNGEKGDLEEWRYKQYMRLLDYIDSSYLDTILKGKIYPKIACYFCGEVIEKKDSNMHWKALEVCNHAIELLREIGRMYYLVELFELKCSLIDKLRGCVNEEQELEFTKQQQEAEEWKKLLLELYEESGVSPYIQYDVHLFRESDSYCIGDIIHLRRKMLGMTKVQLCSGICSERTLTRIEQKQAKTQMPIVRALFERLGLCPEYVRGRVITNDFETLKLSDDFVHFQNNRDLAKAKECLDELEKRLSMEFVSNRQFLERSRALIYIFEKGHFDDVYEKQMQKALEYTIPLEAALKKGDKFLTNEEVSCIHSVGGRMPIDRENRYMSVAQEICNEYIQSEDVITHVRIFELLMSGIESYLGNIGEYDQSDAASDFNIKVNLSCRRMHTLSNNVYNGLWNYEQRIKENLPVKKVYDPHKRLWQCYLLSTLINKKSAAKFFLNKIDKLNNP